MRQGSCWGIKPLKQEPMKHGTGLMLRHKTLKTNSVEAPAPDSAVSRRTSISMARMPSRQSTRIPPSNELQFDFKSVVTYKYVVTGFNFKSTINIFRVWCVRREHLARDLRVQQGLHGRGEGTGGGGLSVPGQIIPFKQELQLLSS